MGMVAVWLTPALEPRQVFPLAPVVVTRPGIDPADFMFRPLGFIGMRNRSSGNDYGSNVRARSVHPELLAVVRGAEYMNLPARGAEHLLTNC